MQVALPVVVLGLLVVVLMLWRRTTQRAVSAKKLNLDNVDDLSGKQRGMG